MEKENIKVMARNREAYHEYFVEEEFEAGISLQGTEVKSIRAGTLNLKDSWCGIKDGEIIARAHNLRESGKNAIYHAELLAIDAACKALGGWRLWQCELFVTLEPCPMCSGAIINSRLKRVVYGARDPKAGCCGSLTDLFALPFNHHPVMEQGLLEEEAQALLQEFFAGLRAKRLKLKAEKRAQQAAPLQNEENPHE